MRGRGSLKVATIRGVELNLHISLLLLLPYLMFVTAARFPWIATGANIDPASLSFGPMGWGVISAIALFVSIVLHEFGHVVVAQSYGVKVRNITLMMLGGMSSMEKMPDKPYAEFKLAVFGPLVSLAIAGAMFLLYRQTQSPDLAFFSYWLGNANLALAIFNLLPAFPLDGGRALRSLLAARQGVVRATQNSVRISNVFAWVLGILGLLNFNVLLMLIAFFIYSAAQSELFFLLTRGVLEGMRTSEVTVRVEPVLERTPLAQVVDQMLALKSPILPVITEAGKPAVVTLQQIRRVPRNFWQTTLVRDVMAHVSRTLSLNDPLGEALPELASGSVNALPVHDNGRIVGYVRYSDVTEILQFKSLAESAQEPDRWKRAA